MLCSFDGCWKTHYAKGLCNSHRKQQLRGEKLTPLREWHPGDYTLESLLELAYEDGECLVWGKSCNQYGYGVARHGGKQWMAHRLAYHLATGSDIDGAQIHHTCANRACVSPAHLQRASHAENSLEMLARKDYEARITALEARVKELEAQLEARKAVIM